MDSWQSSMGQVRVAKTDSVRPLSGDGVEWLDGRAFDGEHPGREGEGDSVEWSGEEAGEG